MLLLFQSSREEVVVVVDEMETSRQLRVDRLDCVYTLDDRAMPHHTNWDDGAAGNPRKTADNFLMVADDGDDDDDVGDSSPAVVGNFRTVAVEDTSMRAPGRDD